MLLTYSVGGNFTCLFDILKVFDIPNYVSFIVINKISEYFVLISKNVLLRNFEHSFQIGREVSEISGGSQLEV